MTDVILVDSHDNPIGIAEKMTAHQQGLLHRAFSVFVIRTNAFGQIETLLQQREEHKYHAGSLWTNTCCSHPEPNETVVHAGQRRLQEEMGFTVALNEIGVFTYRAQFTNGLIEHEVDHVLLGEFKDGIKIDPNPSEVMAYRWVTLEAVSEEYQRDPEIFTPWFQEALEILKKYSKV